MFAPVYFDHNATTPLDPVVLDAMHPWLTQRSGNASSRHEYGRAARRAVDAAREQVAAALGAHSSEIIFTGSGSEANNLLLKGYAALQRPGVLAVSAIEHPCVLEPAGQLVRRGWQLLSLAVDGEGRINVPAYLEALAQRPRLVSVMLANNESGVLQDIPLLASQAKAAGCVFHTDAVQALGKVPLDFRQLNAAGVQAMSVAAHKIGGPMGAAALVLDKRLDLEAQITGGGQERGLRSGSENVAAIVGFGVACQLAQTAQAQEAARLKGLRIRLERGLRQMQATLFSENAERLPNTVYFSLHDLDGETLVGQLDRAGFAVASGSACSSANPELSHVLRAMQVPADLARGAVRVSFGRGNTADQVEDFLFALQATVARLRGLTAMAV